MKEEQEPSPNNITPYRGLRPFTQAEALYFFGREIDTQLIAAHLLWVSGQQVKPRPQRMELFLPP